MSSLPHNRGHPLSPPISWRGGKRSILAEVLDRFPLEYDRYIEVFGGSGVTLFGKEPTPFEVWNDYNADLFNFYYCVKYRHLELLRELNFLPLNSRAEFFVLKDFLEGKAFPPEELNAETKLANEHFSETDAKTIISLMSERCALGDVNRAVSFFKLNRLSYGAGMTTFSLQPCDLRRFYGYIHAAHDRLCEVVLENKDFQDLIVKYDRPGAFFYADPPYYMAESVYAVEFSQADHHRLFEALTNIQGKWLLSYNDDTFVRDLYRDFHQYQFTRLSNLVQRYESGAQYGEILISNYDMDERGKQHEQLKFIFE